MYEILDSTLVFTWPDTDTITDHLVEIFQGIREAAQLSVRIGDNIRIQLPNYEHRGILEARATVDRSFPPKRPGPVYVNQIPDDLYILLQNVDPALYSPYYCIEIPGIFQYIDNNFVAINPEFSVYKEFIFNEVFNAAFCSVAVTPVSAGTRAYTVLARTREMLTRKPRITKTIDFLPVFIALFGEKIAIVIMKEIK